MWIEVSDSTNDILVMFFSKELKLLSTTAVELRHIYQMHRKVEIHSASAATYDSTIYKCR